MGFTLSEPVYHLRFYTEFGHVPDPGGAGTAPQADEEKPALPADTREAADVAVDRAIDKKVGQEHARSGADHLLDEQSPVG